MDPYYSTLVEGERPLLPLPGVLVGGEGGGEEAVFRVCDVEVCVEGVLQGHRPVGLLERYRHIKPDTQTHQVSTQCL